MEQPTTDRVAVIDDDPAVRSATAALLESMGLECGAYDSVEACCRQESLCQLSGLLLEQELPGSWDLLRDLRSHGVLLPVVIVTRSANIPLAVKYMQAGAFHVLKKPCLMPELETVIRQAVTSSQEHRQRKAQIERWRYALQALTQDEREVVQGIAAGIPNVLLAQQLGIGLRTVEKRRRKVYEKLSIDSLPALVQMIFYAAPELLPDASAGDETRG